jgi:hypothetical protein
VRSWLVVLSLAGCAAYDETVHVHLRDVAAVSVHEGEVSVTEPPYYEHAQAGASVERTSSGAVFAHCAWCEWDTLHTVIMSSGDIDLPGSTSVLSGAGDRLRMRYDYIAPLPCHRHRGLCERPAFQIPLETALANVESINYQRTVSTAHGELTGAKLGLGAGILCASLGTAMIAVDVAGETPRARAAVAASGGGFLAIGTFFVYIAVATLRARDSDVPIARAAIQ